MVGWRAHRVIGVVLAMALGLAGLIAPVSVRVPTGSAVEAQAEASGAEIVESGVSAVYRGYYEPIAVAPLYAAAWDGAARAVRGADATALPPRPVFPDDAGEARRVFDAGFPALEQSAAGRLTRGQLVESALRAVAANVHDCHTYYATPEQVRNYTAVNAGEAIVGMGFRLGNSLPAHISNVQEGSPAEAAGLRRGDAVLAINGTPADALSLTEVGRLIRRDEGAVNAVTVRAVDGTAHDLTVTPQRYLQPHEEHAVLPGGVGLIRWYSFVRTAAQTERIEQVLADFEAQGVRAWIFDLRWNNGGNSPRAEALARRFVGDGRLWSYASREAETARVDANGSALPNQRPLAILVDENTVSMAEFMAGGLQALGRATLVGERTAGCIGQTRKRDLADGSAMWVTVRVGLIGPDDLNRHKVGLDPDVPVAAPAEAVLAGQDPQLDAAVRRLLTPGG